MSIGSRVRICLFALLASLASSCSDSFSKKDLVGEWEVNLDETVGFLTEQSGRSFTGVEKAQMREALETQLCGLMISFSEDRMSSVTDIIPTVLTLEYTAELTGDDSMKITTEKNKVMVIIFLDKDTILFAKEDQPEGKGLILSRISS